MDKCSCNVNLIEHGHLVLYVADVADGAIVTELLYPLAECHNLVEWENPVLNMLLLFDVFLTLSRRQVIIITSTFEKSPRAWFCSDRRQISAENRTAHAVRCQKEIFEFYSKMNNL